MGFTQRLIGITQAGGGGVTVCLVLDKGSTPRLQGHPNPCVRQANGTSSLEAQRQLGPADPIRRGICTAESRREKWPMNSKEQGRASATPTSMAEGGKEVVVLKVRGQSPDSGA